MRNSIIVRDPFREFDTLVRRTFGPTAFGPVSSEGERAFVPAVESYRDGDDAVVRVELPGVDVSQDVDVEIRDRQLVISGTRRDERAEDEGGRHLREIRYGSFRRSFRLAGHVTAEAVRASYDAGVLTVRVEGAYAEQAGQRIAITTPEPPAVEAKESAQS